MSKGRGPGVFHSFKQVAEAYEVLRVENTRLVTANEELTKVNQEIRANKLLLATQTTLEQARAEILRLKGESEGYRLDRDRLILENAKFSTYLENLRDVALDTLPTLPGEDDVFQRGLRAALSDDTRVIPEVPA